MAIVYHVQKLDGYTDGRPSWRKYGAAWTRDAAAIKMDSFRKQHPHLTFRIRKIRRRGRS